MLNTFNAEVAVSTTINLSSNKENSKVAQAIHDISRCSLGSFLNAVKEIKSNKTNLSLFAHSLQHLQNVLYHLHFEKRLDALSSLLSNIVTLEHHNEKSKAVLKWLNDDLDVVTTYFIHSLLSSDNVKRLQIADYIYTSLKLGIKTQNTISSSATFTRALIQCASSSYKIKRVPTRLTISCINAAILSIHVVASKFLWKHHSENLIDDFITLARDILLQMISWYDISCTKSAGREACVKAALQDLLYYTNIASTTTSSSNTTNKESVFAAIDIMFYHWMESSALLISVGKTTKLFRIENLLSSYLKRIIPSSKNHPMSFAVELESKAACRNIALVLGKILRSKKQLRVLSAEHPKLVRNLVKASVSNTSLTGVVAEILLNLVTKQEDVDYYLDFILSIIEQRDDHHHRLSTLVGCIIVMHEMNPPIDDTADDVLQRFFYDKTLAIFSLDIILQILRSSTSTSTNNDWKDFGTSYFLLVLLSGEQGHKNSSVITHPIILHLDLRILVKSCVYAIAKDSVLSLRRANDVLQYIFVNSATEEVVIDEFLCYLHESSSSSLVLDTTSEWIKSQLPRNIASTLCKKAVQMTFQYPDSSAFIHLLRILSTNYLSSCCSDDILLLIQEQMMMKKSDTTNVFETLSPLLVIKLLNPVVLKGKVSDNIFKLLHDTLRDETTATLQVRCVAADAIARYDPQHVLDDRLLKDITVDLKVRVYLLCRVVATHSLDAYEPYMTEEVYSFILKLLQSDDDIEQVQRGCIDFIAFSIQSCMMYWSNRERGGPECFVVRWTLDLLFSKKSDSVRICMANALVSALSRLEGKPLVMLQRTLWYESPLVSLTVGRKGGKVQVALLKVLFTSVYRYEEEAFDTNVFKDIYDAMLRCLVLNDNDDEVTLNVLKTLGAVIGKVPTVFQSSNDSGILQLSQTLRRIMKSTNSPSSSVSASVQELASSLHSCLTL